MMGTLLQVEGIQKGFQGTAVLKEISFSLEEGKVLSIIGSSGSGKTTLLRCLNFLETPEGGCIRLGGERLWAHGDKMDETDEALRRKRLHFGLVFQQFHLFPQYTVAENVVLAPVLLYGAKVSGKGARARIREEARETAKELLEKVGLWGKRDAYPHELSGGQQQRVAIARALALKPDILCFDEPTSALDPELTGEVLRVIQGLKRTRTTMIIVTHEMRFAAEISDHVIFMRDGRIEVEGSPAHVFHQSRNPHIQSFLQKTA